MKNAYRTYFSLALPWIILALVMNLTRILFVREYGYLYMNWNLFLALVPVFFVYLYEKEHVPFLRFLTFILWFLFFPNAVYLVTDFIHLRTSGPDWMLWYDGMMLFLYASVGVLSSSFSLMRMKENIFHSFHRMNRGVFLFTVALLSSFGIYLGRYIRMNSWDMVLHPVSAIQQIINTIGDKYAHPVFLMTIVFFTMFIIVMEISFEKVFKKK